MKIVIIGFILIFSIGMNSCGDKVPEAYSIDVNTLDSACGCGDAILIIAKEFERLDYSESADGPTEDQEKLYEKLEDKMDEVKDHCKKEKSFKKKEVKACPSYMEAMEILEGLK